MFLADFFDSPEGDLYANNKATPSIKKSKQLAQRSNNAFSLAEGFEKSCKKTKKQVSLSEDTHMADIITAREYITQAIRDTATKYQYFDFLKMLRTKYGADYSTHVHQQAAKLAKGTN